MRKSCFIYDDEKFKKVGEIVSKKDESLISPSTYDILKERTTYREVEHKEPHEIGAAFANLDSRYHLDMNTEIVEESVTDFAIVQGMVAGKIYSPWIGKLLEDIKSLSVSIKRQGRKEKERMVIGARKQRGLQGWSDMVQRPTRTEK